MRIFCFFISGVALCLSGKPLYDFLSVEVLKDIFLNGINFGQFLWVSVCIIMFVTAVIIFKQTFKIITLTELGVECLDKLGRDKRFLYEEISEIRKPLFFRWGDLFVIVSKSGEKILFSKLMKNYGKIITTIYNKTGCSLVNFPLKEIRQIHTTNG